ncbi:unnamed protein product [Tuber melanosporum]|jgi:ketol-acid reductoisomerase|uniref:(Perigord truffle) hypothetical protein n=1 Tax=Tuber melanosporum (strain Mel28) TaxID=656061 RepID=D5GI77_TUBMM|nr:uncharacterized protein GSTUM_00008321001 [Tuber melanosporum]CAZ84220.1 unnamed protein product [Tuber melanosporum]
MAKIYRPNDASLSPLSSKTILFAGYGNQSRSQALNLRDTFASNPDVSAPKILIANRTDSYHETAIADGFSVTSFAEGAKEADVVFLLVPDQVAPALYNSEIGPNLRTGALVVVASGFNVFYKRLEVEGVDVGMVAPRMIGAGVRSRFLEGGGFPCFVSVENNFSGRALEMILSLALGIGGLTAGAVECSARDETLMDLFAEQAVWPSIIVAFREAYSTLKKLGCSDEALVHELWLSKEPAEVFEKCAEDGFIAQLKYHSTVSQYGQLSTSLGMDATKLQEFFKNVAEKRILGGEFTKEFIDIDKEGGGNGMERKLGGLYAAASTSELAVGEKKVRERMGLDKV